MSAVTPGNGGPADRLEGRVALVTGAASGLGRATALRLAGEGAIVIAADADAERAVSVSREIADAGGEASASELDVRDRPAVDACVARVLDERGRLDLLATFAGVAMIGGFLDLDESAWCRSLDVNLTGTFHCCQAVARAMARLGGGRIVTVASIAGQRAGHGRTAYGASKGGVIMLTRNMAVDLAEHRIAVNAVAPGPVDTPLVRGAHRSGSREAYMRTLPMQRFGNAEEVAAAVTFLLSDDAGYITGHVLDVDGGFMAAGLLDGAHHDG